MPVTAKLSKLFYERLGEQVANELVDWFNAVDATYRGDLRELNEVNFARFDAKLEQRLAELRADLVTRIERLETRLESKLDGKLDRNVAEHAFAQLSAKIDQAIAGLEARLERRLGKQTRWLLAGWVTLLASVIGLWIRG